MPTKKEEPKEAPDPVVPEKEDDSPEVKEQPQEDAPYQDPTAIPYVEPPRDPVQEMEARLEALLEQRLDQIAKRMEGVALKAIDMMLPMAVTKATNDAQVAAANKPPLTLRAGIADNFIKSPNAKSPHLGHYRCERFKAVKVQEFDMQRWRAIESGEISWPVDKDGRPRKLQVACKLQGQHIPFLEGHAYPTTQNQVDTLMLYKNEIPYKEGGMPDLYEDTSVEPFRCTVCQNSTDMWPTREGYEAHMFNVHKVVPQAVAA